MQLRLRLLEVAGMLGTDCKASKAQQPASTEERECKECGTTWPLAAAFFKYVSTAHGYADVCKACASEHIHRPTPNPMRPRLKMTARDIYKARSKKHDH